MDKFIDLMNTWAGVILLGVLFLFILFGFLWGVIRGLKRSWMRTATLVGFLGLTLLLTPVIAKGVYNMPIKVYHGMTIAENVDHEINSALENPDTQTMVTRIRTIMPDFEIFVKGIGFAIVNLVLFFVLFFVMIGVSWIVYAILAHIYARKREKPAKGEKVRKRDLAKIPQHRWWGGLVGVANGLVMFFFFTVAVFPWGGGLSVLHDIAKHEKFNGEVVLAASAEGVSKDADEVFEYVRKIDSAFYESSVSAKIYNGITKYTGLQFLARKSFDYQTTISLKTKDDKNKTQKVVLSNDLVKGANLAEDTLAIMARYDRIKKILKEESTDPKYEPSMTDVMEYMSVDKDYRAIKIVLDELFGLTSFKVVNASVSKVDELLAAGDAGTNYFGAKTASGLTVQQNSFYAKWADEYAVANKKPDFVLGMSALVSKVGDKGLNLLRDELKNYIDLGAYAFKTNVGGQSIYRNVKNNYDDGEIMKVIEFLAKPAPNATVANNTIFMELADRAVINSQFFSIIGAENADKLLSSLTISKDKKPFISEDGYIFDGKTVVSKTELVKFMGTAATGENGQWRRVIRVFDGFVTAGAQFTDLPIKGKPDEIMKYIANAANMPESKTDTFAVAFYNAATVFGKSEGTPYTFLNQYLTGYEIPVVEFGGTAKINMNETDGVKQQMLVRLFGTGADQVKGAGGSYTELGWNRGEVDAWKYQFRSATIWKMIGDTVGDILKNQINGMTNGLFDINFADGKAGETIQKLMPIINDVIKAIDDPNGLDTEALAKALVGGDADNPDYSSLLALADSGASVGLEDNTYDNTMNELSNVLGGDVSYNPSDRDAGLTGSPNLTDDELAKYNVKTNEELMNKINSLIKPKT